jgi:hypothetical protein
MQTEKADKTWRLLVKKVVRARAMVGLTDRRVPDVVAVSWARYIGGSKWAKLTACSFGWWLMAGAGLF